MRSQRRIRTAPQCGAEVVPSVITGMLHRLPGEGGLGLPDYFTATQGLVGSLSALPFPAQRAASGGSNERS